MTFGELFRNFTALTITGLIVFIFLFLIFLARFLRKVDPGKALIIISPFYKNGPKVTFTGGFVFPIIHRTKEMDISTKVMPVSRMGDDGLICKDNIRADITVHFYVRINKNVDDVRQVATSIGCERASTPQTLNDLFQAKFSEALKTVGKQMEYAELFQERTRFKEEIIKTIGRDLNGYKLEDTAIDYLSQTPLDKLDPNDIMDSEGIKKITELTSIQAIRTNEINQEKSETITKRNVEARERILELERQEEEALAKQKAQIAIIQARENAEMGKIVQEERLKAEAAQIATDEQLGVAGANKEREIEIANKNKERVVLVEIERIEKERQLEVTEREKVVALAQIAKEKALEGEKKNIQEIIKERVALERHVAEEEEKTKDTRADMDADRKKRVHVKEAEQVAEGNLIKDIKAAEAKEKAAQHTAKEKEILADAEKVASLRLAEAKEILAKGVIAEESASGLADIKVQKANAEAILAKGEAEAGALKLRGEADAAAMRAKFEAEANGIKEKAESMKLFDTVGKEHEEFKLKLAMQEKLELENIRIKKDIAMAQAEVLSAAMRSAHIDIVGGEAAFLDKIIGAIGDAKSKSALIEHNSVLTEFKDALLRPGENNLLKRIKKIIDKLGISTEAIKNLSVSALVAKLLRSTDDEGLSRQLTEIKDLVEKSGFGDLVMNFKELV